MNNNSEKNTVLSSAKKSRISRPKLRGRGRGRGLKKLEEISSFEVEVEDLEHH
jgi:hypothetical protein